MNSYKDKKILVWFENHYFVWLKFDELQEPPSIENLKQNNARVTRGMSWLYENNITVEDLVDFMDKYGGTVLRQGEYNELSIPRNAKSSSI